MEALQRQTIRQDHGVKGAQNGLKVGEDLADVVAAAAEDLHQPAQGREDSESFGFVGSLDDLQRPSPLVGERGLQLVPGVAAKI